MLVERAQGVRGRRAVEGRESLDDPGGREPRQHRRGRENDQRTGHDAGNRLPGPSLAVEREPLDEDGDEGRAQDPAQDEVEEHVGHGVGQVEGVGDRGEAEHPREDEDPQQTREARDQGAARHRKDPRAVRRARRHLA